MIQYITYFSGNCFELKEESNTLCNGMSANVDVNDELSMNQEDRH